VEIEPTILPTSVKRESAFTSNVSRTASVKDTRQTSLAEVESVALEAKLAVLPNTAPSTTEAEAEPTAAASADPPASAVDPVSGRYGL